ncbi:hypothetical protein AB0N14_13570 [Streptomyces sp. NPDC051104]|uniref:hypothetical protein n=1 Tax=Streptomyces sp. NPDC051104 TaxID=3155044 RepID=UPI00342CCF81
MSDDPSEARRRANEALDREQQRLNRWLIRRMAMWALILVAIVAIVGTARSWW